LVPTAPCSLFALVENTDNNTHYIRDDLAGLAENTVYCGSYFVKASERSWCYLDIKRRDNSDLLVWFNLSLGIVGTVTAGFSDVGIEDWGDGLFRVWAAGDVLAGATTPFFGIGLAIADGIDAYTGDGASAIHAGFAQVEEEAFPSSYIETGAATVAREADSAVITNLSWLDETQGAFAIDGALIGHVPGTTSRIIALQDEAGNQTHDYFWNGGTSVRVNYFDGTSHVLDTGIFTPGTAFNIASAYSLDSIAATRDGGDIVAAGSGGSLPTGMTRLVLGNSGNLQRPMFGTIKRIRYWPFRLSNDELIQVTR